jgi:hypothetical protein
MIGCSVADPGQRRPANAVERRMGSTAWAPLAAYLGFRIVYANGRTWRPDGRPRVPAQVAAV